MIATRVAPWLLRHPMSAVILALALLGGTAWGIAYAVSARQSRPDRPAMVEGGVAASVLPEPTQIPPRARVDQAHRALHAMARACERPFATRGSDALRRPVEVMERFARDYPHGGFIIDDEPGSTLALLVVVRSELLDCDPSLVPGVEELLPEEFRDPL